MGVYAVIPNVSHPSPLTAFSSQTHTKSGRTKIRVLQLPPFTINVGNPPIEPRFPPHIGRIPYEIGIVPFRTEAILGGPAARDLFIIGARDLNPVVWLRNNWFLADTFFLTEREAKNAYETGFIVGDQDDGDADPVVLEIVKQISTVPQEFVISG
jgi:hypothetical protein